MSTVDLCYPIIGTTIPLDHGYKLYAAVSRLVGPAIHECKNIGIHPVHGLRSGPGLLSLTDVSRLRIRTPIDHIPLMLKLSGKSMDVDGHHIRIGVPQTRALVLASALYARLVTIKDAQEPDPFLIAARRKLVGTHEHLNELGFSTEVQAAIPLHQSGQHQGKPMRRILRIKDKTVVGYSLIVSELSAEESLTLQEKGLGGRRHMGCGVFVPSSGSEEA